MNRAPGWALLLSLLTALPVRAEDLSVLDRVCLNTLRLQALDTDVLLYLGWDHDSPDGFKKTARASAAAAQELIRQDQALDPPAELKELVGAQERALQKQVLLYQGIESKDKTAVQKGYQALNDDLQALYKDQDEALAARAKALGLPNHAAPLEAEAALAPDAKAAGDYRRGVELIRGKKYAEALDVLMPLRKTNGWTAFGACLALRVSDALALGADQIAPNPGKQVNDPEERARWLLKDLLDRAPYSPVVFESFLKWRTLTQMDDHGMSNLSDIPNDQYNQVREKCLAGIREYQKTHPQDALAEDQALGLLVQPNIDRGGTMGNTNLSFWGTLYTEPRYYYDQAKKE